MSRVVKYFSNSAGSNSIWRVVPKSSINFPRFIKINLSVSSTSGGRWVCGWSLNVRCHPVANGHAFEVLTSSKL